MTANGWIAVRFKKDASRIRSAGLPTWCCETLATACRVVDRPEFRLGGSAMAPPCGSPLPCRILRRTSPEVQIPLINPELTASEIAAGLETLAILDDAPLRGRSPPRSGRPWRRSGPSRASAGWPAGHLTTSRMPVAWPRRRAHGVLVGPYSGDWVPALACRPTGNQDSICCSSRAMPSSSRALGRSRAGPRRAERPPRARRSAIPERTPLGRARSRSGTARAPRACARLESVRPLRERPARQRRQSLVLSPSPSARPPRSA